MKTNKIIEFDDAHDELVIEEEGDFFIRIKGRSLLNIRIYSNSTITIEITGMSCLHLYLFNNAILELNARWDSISHVSCRTNSCIKYLHTEEDAIVFISEDMNPHLKYSRKFYDIIDVKFNSFVIDRSNHFIFSESGKTSIS